ncbi:MAG: hypothetical protein K0R15_2656 [Clostridiales bacterium]|jgi:hypothetical protein|nr:hypothetical protein [Clostridiales bacterium]
MPPRLIIDIVTFIINNNNNNSVILNFYIKNYIILSIVLLLYCYCTAFMFPLRNPTEPIDAYSLPLTLVALAFDCLCYWYVILQATVYP